MIFKKYFNNLVKIPSLYLFVLKCYKRQKQFMKETILLDLEDIKKNNDQSLTEKDFKKITFYYGLAVPVIGEIFCLLRGTKMTNSERKTLTYLGGLTGLFDDFFDELETTEEHIKELINNPSIELGKNSHEILFIKFYLKALEQDHSKSIKKYFNEGFDAQVESKKQTDPNLPSEEILKITQQKGGIFILLYRAALDGHIPDFEKELLFNIGLLGQLENDIFDIYKDHKAGICTLATTTKSMFVLRSRYQSIMNDVFELIDQTSFPKSNKKKFSRLFSIVASRGLVCLDQLIKLENEGFFELSMYSKEQLICNMGKLKNTFKWVKFYLNWNIGTKY